MQSPSPGNFSACSVFPLNFLWAGPVRVSLEVRQPPPAAEPGDWQEIVEATVFAPTGRLHVETYEGTSFPPEITAGQRPNPELAPFMP
jgi:hypothetical protein